MSGYYGYPSVAGFCAPPQQLPPSAMNAAAAAVTGSGYPMLSAMPQMPLQPSLSMPAAMAPAAIPYIPTGYTGVYGSPAPVQPMAYAMNQVPQQQQVPMFHQQAMYQPPPPPLPLQPPPLPMQQQQQQQPAWQPMQQPPSTAAMSNYRQQHQPQYQRQTQQHRPPPHLQTLQQQGKFHPPQHQQPPRPQQTQQQPPRPQQTQQQPPRPQQTQQQPPRPQQTQQQPPRPQQQVQRPPLRPRGPTVAGQRAHFPTPAQRPTAPAAGAATPRPSVSGPIGRMWPASQQQRQPPPLFLKPNLRAVPSSPGNAVAASATGRKPLTASLKASPGNDNEELQHCPPIPGGVGTEYVVQIRTDQRGAAALQYHCRLCDCRFTDLQARDMHVKGRRHRLQFKRKVDPRLSVDAKPAIKGRRGGLSTQDSVAAAAAAVPSETANEAANRRRREEEQRLRDMQELEWSNYAGCKHGGFWGGGAGQPRRPESNDDRQVLAKHSSVYPTEAELHAVQQLVTRCERALKLASDHLSSEAEAPASAPLRGVMRVGALAKGLLLHGDLATQLVLLCAAWPTKDLRDRIIQLLPERLESNKSSAASAESPGDEQQPQQQQIQVRLDEEEGCILVQDSTEASGGGLELTCSVYLTSPAVREEAGADNPEPEGALDRDKCLEALAALRQAKWFQAKASSLQSCVPVIRVLRDMCQRLPIWAPLPEWAMELLVERSISSACGGQLLSPGEAIRRVMECLASGILLPSGPGLRDPCEKAPVDAATSMTAQEREDITASAQQALRLIAFRQLHRVLDMAPLVPPPTAAAPAAGAEVISKQKQVAPPGAAATLAAAASKRPAAAAAGPDLNAKQARLA